MHSKKKINYKLTLVVRFPEPASCLDFSLCNLARRGPVASIVCMDHKSREVLSEKELIVHVQLLPFVRLTKM